MRVKPRDFTPHPSHDMSEWEPTVLSPSGTPRFYDVRECRHCGGEEAKGNAHFADDELSKECVK